MDRGGDYTREASIAKLKPAGSSAKSPTLACNFHGGMGYMRNIRWPAIPRFALDVDRRRRRRDHAGIIAKFEGRATAVRVANEGSSLWERRCSCGIAEFAFPVTI